MEMPTRLEKTLKWLKLDKEGWEWLKENIRPHKQRMIALTVWSVFQAGFNAAMPLVSKHILDDAFERGIWSLVWALTYVGLVLVASFPVAGFIMDPLAGRYRQKERLRILDHLMRLFPANTHGTDSKAIATKIGGGIQAGADVLVLIFVGGTILSIPVALLSFGYFFVKAPLPGTVLVVWASIFLVLSVLAAKRQRHYQTEMDKKDEPMLTRYQEAIAQTMGLQILRAEPFILDWYAKHGDERLAFRDKWKRFVRLVELLSELASHSPHVLLIFLLLPFLAGKQISFGDFMALQLYATYAVVPLVKLGDKHQALVTAYTKIKRSLEVTKLVPAIKEAPDAVDMSPLHSGIAVRDLHFAFPEGVQAIDGISFDIPARSNVAFVGDTGGGKSAIWKLLARFWEPQAGSICYDGVEVSKLTLSSLRQQTFVLLQEPTALTGKFGENVLLGMEDFSVSAENLQWAIGLARAEFVLKRGLDARMGETGSKISRGELQRIAMVRLLLRLKYDPPSVVVFDEATSALDNTTERIVMGSVIALMKQMGITIIHIAHRLSTVQDCDQIFVVAGSKIVDRGTHEELLERCEIYRDLQRETKKSERKQELVVVK